MDQPTAATEATKPTRTSQASGADHAHTQLMQRVQHGDQTAFAALYDALAPRIFGLVYRVLGDHSHSEEVTQEVFLHAWQQANSYSPGLGSPASWLLTIAHRRAVDRVRSTQSSTERDEKIGTRNVDVAYDVVLEDVEQLETRAHIRAALDTLTEAQRECVLLAYHGGYSQTQIAHQLNIPLGTVKSRVREGMSQLRKILGSAQ